MSKTIQFEGDIIALKQQPNRDLVITVLVECPSTYVERNLHFGEKIVIIQEVGTCLPVQ